MYVHIHLLLSSSRCSKALRDPGIDRVGKLGSDGNPLVRNCGTINRLCT